MVELKRRATGETDRAAARRRGRADQALSRHQPAMACSAPSSAWSPAAICGRAARKASSRSSPSSRCVGIALGVATLIIVMSVMNGFRAELLGRILGLNGHLTVMRRGRPASPISTPLADAAAAGAGRRRGDADGRGPGAGHRPTAAPRGALVRGIRPDDLRQRRLIADNIVAGSLDEFAGDDDGRRSAAGWRSGSALGIGDELTLISPQGSRTAFGTVPRVKTYKVVAIFEVGMYEYDNSFVFMPLEAAQMLLPDDATGSTRLEIMVDRPRRGSTPCRRRSRRARSGRTCASSTGSSATPASSPRSQVERNVMFLILTLIILVAAFNIISGLIMLVKDKGARHRHPAHHGRHARRDPAHLPAGRRHHRHRRHAGRACCSASPSPQYRGHPRMAARA